VRAAQTRKCGRQSDLEEEPQRSRITARYGGTVVTVQGPLLDPRLVALVPGSGLGGDQHDCYLEGWLARELELCYANISMVSDHDVGVEGEEPALHKAVVRVFNENNEKLRELLFAASRGWARSHRTSARSRSSVGGSAVRQGFAEPVPL
jgi:purine nucleoside phosphorylase